MFKVFIILILVVQLLWMGMIVFAPLRYDYRLVERTRVRLAWEQAPSAASRAAYDEELKRLHSYLWIRNTLFVVVLGIEGLGIYYWRRNYGNQKVVV
jgi:hypothetical protein